MRWIVASAVFLFALGSAAPAFAQYEHYILPNDVELAVRRVMAPVQGTAWLHAYYSNSAMGDISIIGTADKGTSCPAMFRIVYPDSSPRYPQYHATQEFGDCTDVPTIEFAPNRIIIRFGGWPKSQRHSFVAPSTYVFANRTLRQLNKRGT